MDIVVIVLDLMHVHNFHGQMVAGVKIFLYLESLIVLLCMLIIKKYIYILALSEGPTQGLCNTTITAEAKHPINFTDSGK